MTASVERGNDSTKIVRKQRIRSQQEETAIVVKHVHHFLIVTNMSTWQIVVQRRANCKPVLERTSEVVQINSRSPRLVFDQRPM